MRNFWDRQSVRVKTLLVFIFSVMICIPLFFLLEWVTEPELLLIIGSSAIGWFAGGVIIGTYVWYSRAPKDK